MPTPTRVEVLGNGVDTDALPTRRPGERERPRELGLPSSRWRCSSVGSCPRRASTWSRPPRGDDYDIVFAGGDRPPGVDDPRLHFLGAVPAAEMPRGLRAAPT